MNNIEIKYIAAMIGDAAFQNMKVVPDHPVALMYIKTAKIDSNIVSKLLKP